MNIHSIYAKIFKIWRGKRFALFVDHLKPGSDDVVLDVGGYPNTWTRHQPVGARIDCLNLDPINWAGSDEYNITTVVGDGCALKYEDDTYDILFSNSVIEHVGDWDRQRAFAEEVRRVGKRLWIQTPAFECPLEPHFLAPFVHWLPAGLRRVCVRWFTPWGWITKPSKEKVAETVEYTQLLTKSQMRKLFPDCEIITERMLWIIPKSYVAYRVEGGAL